MTTKSYLKYRNVWMGIAMIWIIWYHTGLTPSFTPLRFLYWLGYGGVDICLFASGVGCFLSLCKDSDPYRFIKRRIARLYPTYICFIPFWLLFMSATAGMPVFAIIGNLLGIQNFTGLGNDFNWYISAIFLLYLLTPLFKSFLDQTDRSAGYFVFTLLLVAFSLPFHNADNLITTATRLPVYFLGMLFGKLCFQRTSLSRRIVAGSLIMSAAGAVMMAFFFKLCAPYLWSNGLYWYPFILITPGMCLLISLVMENLEKYAVTRFLIRILDLIGQYSFELYLVHVFVFCTMDSMLRMLENTALSTYIWPLAFASILLGSLALRLCAQTVKKIYAALLHSLSSHTESWSK